jgi:hypothetical protein
VVARSYTLIPQGFQETKKKDKYMAKNMTRKGLAFGAGAALVASGFVGIAPASASETLTLAPSAGTSYKVLSTSSFKLAAGFAGTESSSAQYTLKYRVVNSAGADMTFTVIENGAAVTETDVVYGSTTDAAGTAADVVVASSDDNPEIGAENSIEIELAPVSATNYSITVQAWLDVDGGNDIDAGEARSPIRTIEFVDHASLTGAVVLEAPVIGAATMTATATVDGVNYDQLDSNDVAIKFLANGVALGSTDDVAVNTSGTGAASTTVAARKNPNVASWSAVDAELSATIYPELSDATGADLVYDKLVVAGSTVYSAQLMLLDHAGAYQEVTGAANNGTASDGIVTALTAPAEANGSSVTADDNKLRAGSGEVSVSTTATVPAGKSKAGHTVTFKIEEATLNELAAGNSFTAGGKTLTNSSATSKQSISVAVVTDADGKATLPISYVGLKDADAVVISVSTLGAAAVVSGAGTLTLTGEDSLATAIEDSVYSGELSYARGASVSVAYTLVDQFGQTPTGTFRLVMSEDSSSANFSGYQAVSDGKATFSTVDNSTVANTYDLTATVQKLGTDGVTWSAIGGGLSEVTAVNVLASAVAASAISASATDDGATTALPLELDNTYTGSKELKQQSVAFPTLVDVSTVTFTVTSATGAIVVGAPVTVTADKQVQLATDSDNWFGVGSISGTTNANGQFAVKVYSNLAGTVNLTATSGSASKSQSLKFATAKDDTATVVAVSAPTNATPGSTLQVTVKLTDKYGNPVVTSSTATGFNDGTTAPTLSISYTGPGLRVGELPTVTGANGEASFAVLLGANDSGSIVVTASYDADGTATAKAAVSSSATIAVGAAPAAKTAYFTKRAGDKIQIVSQGSAKVAFFLNGKRVASRQSLGTLNRTSDLVDGKNVIEIYVDGKRVLRRAATK